MEKGRAALAAARAAAGAIARFGMEAGWWDGVVARAGALADLLETLDPDADHVVELASSLRADLRPYI